MTSFRPAARGAAPRGRLIGVGSDCRFLDAMAGGTAVLTTLGEWWPERVVVSSTECPVTTRLRTVTRREVPAYDQPASM
jgi:hypothetical protein